MRGMIAFCLAFVGCVNTSTTQREPTGPDAWDRGALTQSNELQTEDRFIFDTVRTDDIIAVHVFRNDRDNLVLQYVYLRSEYRGDNPVVFGLFFGTIYEGRIVSVVLGFMEGDEDDFLGYLLGVVLSDFSGDSPPEQFSCGNILNLSICVDMLGRASVFRERFDLDRRLQEAIREGQ